MKVLKDKLNNVEKNATELEKKSQKSEKQLKELQVFLKFEKLRIFKFRAKSPKRIGNLRTFRRSRKSPKKG